MERRYAKRIKHSRNKDFKTFLLAHSQVIVADAEDTLQIFMHKLERVISKNDQKIQKS
jgi:hypothetical protein